MKYWHWKKTHCFCVSVPDGPIASNIVNLHTSVSHPTIWLIIDQYHCGMCALPKRQVLRKCFSITKHSLVYGLAVECHCSNIFIFLQVARCWPPHSMAAQPYMTATHMQIFLTPTGPWDSGSVSYAGTEIYPDPHYFAGQQPSIERCVCCTYWSYI